MMNFITLRNGLRIVNFSSPHPFKFTSGEILPACSPEKAKELMLKPIEIEHQQGGWVDIELSFQLSEAVVEELNRLNEDNNVDIILVPLPVMTALKQAGKDPGKCRVCRVSDRVKKTVYPDRFCI